MTDKLLSEAVIEKEPKEPTPSERVEVSLESPLNEYSHPTIKISEKQPSIEVLEPEAKEPETTPVEESSKNLDLKTKHKVKPKAKKVVQEEKERTDEGTLSSIETTIESAQHRLSVDEQITEQTFEQKVQDVITIEASELAIPTQVHETESPREEGKIVEKTKAKKIVKKKRVLVLLIYFKCFLFISSHS